RWKMGPVPSALPGPAPRPRSLPADEPLSPEDYRRLVGVVEAVDHAADLAEFRERLVRALRAWFGFQGVAVLHGATLGAAVAEGCGVQSGYTADFLADYEARWIREDPMRDPAVLAGLADAGVLRLGEVVAADDRFTPFVERCLRPYGVTDKAAMVVDAA